MKFLDLQTIFVGLVYIIMLIVGTFWREVTVGKFSDAIIVIWTFMILIYFVIMLVKDKI